MLSWLQDEKIEVKDTGQDDVAMETKQEPVSTEQVDAKFARNVHSLESYTHREFCLLYCL